MELYPTQPRTLTDGERRQVIGMFQKVTGKDCQLPESHTCEGGVQLHHITPHRETTRVYGLSGRRADYPRRTAPICKKGHIGVSGLSREEEEEFVIHPDVPMMRREYGRRKNNGDPNPNAAFTEGFASRDELYRQGQSAHNTRYDARLSRIADEVVAISERDGDFDSRQFYEAYRQRVERKQRKAS